MSGTLTLDDFKNSGWEECKPDNNNLPKNFAVEYMCNFRDKENVAKKSGNEKNKRIFNLLANICSLVLNSDSKIFQNACFFSDNTTSFKLSDLLEADVDFLKLILNHIDDYRLRARVGDVIWSHRKTDNFDSIEIAVEAYEGFFAHIDLHPFMCQREILRYIHLCKSCKFTGKLDSLIKMLTNKLQCDVSNNNSQAKLCLYAKWLFECGYDKDKLIEILIEIINPYKNKVALNLIQNLLKDYKIFPNKNQNFCRIYDIIAQSYIAMSKKCVLYMDKRRHILEAINIYKSFPKKDLKAFISLDNFKNLKDKYDEYNIKIIKNMTTVPSTISQIHSHVGNLIKNKSKSDAIQAIVDIVPMVNYNIFKCDILNDDVTNFLCNVSQKIIYNSIERVRYVRQPLNNNIDEDIVLEHLLNYTAYRGAFIKEAIECLRKEHDITLDDVCKICCISVHIPIDRSGFWEKGLYYGFMRDFSTAAHLLTAQIEHLIRCRLEDKNIKTYVLENDGVQTEKGVTNLLIKEEDALIDILGMDLYFELLVLFSKKGLNLRNEMYHGLLTYEIADSSYSAFLWWLALKMIYYGFKDE